MGLATNVIRSGDLRQRVVLDTAVNSIDQLLGFTCFPALPVFCLEQGVEQQYLQGNEGKLLLVWVVAT